MSPGNTETFGGFGPQAVDFYRELDSNNNRDWWQEHRTTYDTDIAGPLTLLGEALAPRFGEVKVFRPYRDVRFSPDKRPIKEHAALYAASEKGGTFYLQIGGDGLYLAGGAWQPERAQLERFRSLLDQPASAAGIRKVLTNLAQENFVLAGGTLTGAPRGYRRDHPEIELLRRTSLAVGKQYPDEDWLFQPSCLDRIVEGWKHIAKWNAWLRTHTT